jgi:hypothetical protein
MRPCCPTFLASASSGRAVGPPQGSGRRPFRDRVLMPTCRSSPRGRRPTERSRAHPAQPAAILKLLSARRALATRASEQPLGRESALTARPISSLGEAVLDRCAVVDAAVEAGDGRFVGRGPPGSPLGVLRSPDLDGGKARVRVPSLPLFTNIALGSRSRIAAGRRRHESDLPLAMG